MVLQARPLSYPGTRKRAGEVRLPNRPLKQAQKVLAGEGIHKVFGFGCWDFLLTFRTSKIPRKVVLPGKFRSVLASLIPT